MTTYTKTKVAYVTILAKPEVIVGSPWEPPPSFSFGYAGDADVSLGVTPTRPGLWWFHAMGEEIRNVIAAAGLTQDLTDATQLTTAIRALIGVAAPAPTLLGSGSGSSQAVGAAFLTVIQLLLAAGRDDARGSGLISVRPLLSGSGTAAARGAGRSFASVLAGSGVAFARGTGNFNTLSGSGTAVASGSAALVP